MRTRILPREEWGRLDVTELPALLAHVRPEDAEVLVVEDGDRLAACLAAVRVTHLEGLWIAPEYRGNAGVGRRLLRGARDVVSRWRPSWVWAGATSDCMRDVLARLGAARLSLDSYVFRMVR